MFVDFFIKRPIFSTVLALIIVLAGAVCIPILPVAQFPNIAPPTVQIASTYTGADAVVVENTVTMPIETQVNGVEGMTYMSSLSGSDGSSIINVTFDVGYDLNVAAMDVQNFASFAAPQLPEDVRRYGVTTKKQATDFIMVVHLLSPDGTFDDLFLSNYASINICDVLRRIFGVGNVQIFGERKYSMRVWLDPNKLTSMNMTSQDVISAVREQNLQVAAGSVGAPPASPDIPFQYTITTKGRLETVEEFENIIVRTDTDGAVVRIKDVGRVELGAENYKWFSKMDNKHTAAIGVFQLPGANSINIANAVYEDMKELSKRFPKGMKYEIDYDTTLFVRESIGEVVETLFIAVLLVFAVIFIFLQDWRATVIPAITIPVSLVGTFAILMLFGFSINTLTLFGLVLAIGLVVDDAIVVVENVSRILTHDGLSQQEATMKGMREVTGPVIATTLVLMAVFIPVSFMPGITGQLYKQFALTIAFSVGISAINALTLSPAMCALILRPETEKRNWFFQRFNAAFDWLQKSYESWVSFLIKKWKAVLVAFVALLGITYLVFGRVPTGFLPPEDQGYFIMLIMGQQGSSLMRTQPTVEAISEEVKKIDGVQNVMLIGGYNGILGTFDTSFASMFVILKPWHERGSELLSLNAIMGKSWKVANQYPDMTSVPFNPPPIRGLSNAGGFQFMLEDLQSGPIDKLYEISQQMIAEAKKRPELTHLSTSFKINYPQYYIDLDRTKAKSLDVPLNDIFSILQAQLGSVYVNDFNKFGRVYRVFLQADKGARSEKVDITNLYVRSNKGVMIPLSSLVSVNEIMGPQNITHYNLYRSVEIDGDATAGYSSGQAIKAMQETAEKVLPDGYWYEWTGVALQQIKAGNMAPLIFALALAFVFLFLAAQYESWSMPLMIMLAVPLAILGALSAQWIRGLANDTYCQIGLVMLIGLACKNSILIVEFAKEKREGGMSIVEAALTAVRIRLRPILMTAFAFILGVLPLVFAKGAGEASRHSLGTAVFGGMIVATFLSLLVVPVLYVVIETFRERKTAKE